MDNCNLRLTSVKTLHDCHAIIEDASAYPYDPYLVRVYILPNVALIRTVDLVRSLDHTEYLYSGSRSDTWGNDDRRTSFIRTDIWGFGLDIQGWDYRVPSCFSVILHSNRLELFPPLCWQ